MGNIRFISTVLLLGSVYLGFGQVMTPELLWSLGRVSAIGLTDDATALLYRVTIYNVSENDRSSTIYRLDLASKTVTTIASIDSFYSDPSISSDGNWQIIEASKKVNPVDGKDFHPEMDKSNVYIYDQLNYRHWDTWEDGAYSHLLLKNLMDTTAADIDIMDGEPYSTPTEPFGGSEDYSWNADGTAIYYVCKKEYGTAYTKSTNTDIYTYDIASGITSNVTSNNKGYDTHPVFSPSGKFAWLQMDEPGYEADKNDIVYLKEGNLVNLTESWDGTVSTFTWGDDDETIYFIAPISGTRQLFSIKDNQAGEINQITEGQFDVTSIIDQKGDQLFVTRTDMNHAAEIYSVDLANGSMEQLTHVNDEVYAAITLSEVKQEMVTTTDGKQLLSWVIYPPNFDPTKKYPTLLYCQGGPQAALSQFYSFRWNFQLMAANGYIIVAPNRRGMPGYGVEWNEQISGDWGGQNMQDYLSTIDHMNQYSYVDTSRLGCVGASYGGYSVFYLAGIHEGRFKSFIAHDGVFNTRSMYGTTEELFFVNKDLGGPYWENPTAPSYNAFNPINGVAKWDTPMLIIQGGKDYRVPVGQGLEAFQAAQLKGLKSKLLYFPEENHWILSAQNGIIWQREFFKWLGETVNPRS